MSASVLNSDVILKNKKTDFLRVRFFVDTMIVFRTDSRVMQERGMN